MIYKLLFISLLVPFFACRYIHTENNTAQNKSELKDSIKHGKVLIYNIDNVLCRIDWYSEERKDSSIFFDNQGKQRIIFEEVDSFPVFEQTNFKFQDFCNTNLKQPDGYSGFVLISFIIEVNSNISDIVIEKSLCQECDKNAVEVIKKMPKFRPATKNNINVPFLCFLPIRFKN